MNGQARSDDTAAQFSRRAEKFAGSAAHFSADSLKAIGRLASERRYSLAVDVATGPGFTAFEVAPYCGHVIAMDPAKGMLEQARRIAAERGIENVELQQAYADSLPVDNESAGLVTCRTAPHHFPSVPDFLAEASRVLEPGGALIMADTSAPEDDALDRWMNEMELRRDATHVRDLKHSEWRTLLGAAGLEQDHETTTRVYLDVRDWCARTRLSAGATEAVLADWRNAPDAAVQAFGITRLDSPAVNSQENYSFSWPVFVARAFKR